MNEAKTMNIGLKLQLIVGFIIIIGIGGYFTYTALNQGIMFAYIENLTVQGLDKNIIFDYVVLLLIKTLAAFAMYSFIISFVFMIVGPLMILSPIIIKRIN